MNIGDLSTPGLLALYEAIRAALVIDDNLPKNSKKVFEVRETPDWKAWANQLSTELDKRNVEYLKIDW